MEIVSNGATFKVDGYVPPLLTGTFGIIQRRFSTDLAAEIPKLQLAPRAN
jgi:hypothetical protein